MMPAQPPPPTASYLPFQSLAGNHTSMSTFESDDGFNVAATRQNAGICNGWACGPPPVGPCAGARKGPAVTDSATVMVVSGIESDFNRSHGVWAATVRAVASSTIVAHA